jgi:hypothetical protein
MFLAIQKKRKREREREIEKKNNIQMNNFFN